MRSNLKELLAVLEDIRAKEYPEIPSEVIEMIVNTQYENQDDRARGRNKTSQIITDFLNKATSD